MTEQRTGEPGMNELAALVGPFWTEPKVSVALRASVEELAARRHEGTILGLATSDGDLFYPLSQFQQRDGSVEVKPGLLPLFRALRAFDPWAVAVLLHTPSVELDGVTPLEWTRHTHAPEGLADLGHLIASEWGTGTAR